MEEYQRDILAQKHSGPHPIDDERRSLNKTVAGLVKDIIPFNDIHKKSDCDLIYRFLIAKKWDVNEAAKGLREYMAFRQEHNLNTILWEGVDPEVRSVLACEYSGFDKEGHPIFSDKPDPKGLGILLTKFSKESLMRTHFRMMEEGRRCCQMFQTDRVTCILDLSLLNMSVITNPAAMGFLKSMAHIDQTMYPENMRFMLICNGGWTFSSMYKILKPLLDPRVQQKINFIGNNYLQEMAPFVLPEYIPASLGGSSKGEPLVDYVALAALPAGTPPAIKGAVVDDLDIDIGSPTLESKHPVPEYENPEDLL